MKFDIERCIFNTFGSSNYEYKYLTDEMKRTLVKEAKSYERLDIFFKKLIHNYETIQLSKRMNEPDAFKIVRYDSTTGEPIYRWQIRTEVFDLTHLSLEEEVLNFIYWLNPEKVKQFSE